MDVKNKNKIESVQEQLPQIKRITTLDEVKRIKPSRLLPPPAKKGPGIPKVSIKLFLIGLLFFSIVGLGLAIFTIYRYHKENKRLYQTSVTLKNEFLQTRRELKKTNEVKNHIVKSRNSLLQAYRERSSLYDKLQLKENSYKTLLTAKASWIGTLQGNLRVATAQIEALKVQRDLLASRAEEMGEQIYQLTTQLLNNIDEQELLVNENLKLREEREWLARELFAIKTQNQLPEE